MTAAPFFIGDEITAAGYRLAGAQVMTPAHDPDTIAAALKQAQTQAGFVLLTQEYAQALPAAALDAALAVLTPPLVIVPDARNRAPLADISARLRAQLGVEE